MSTSSKITLLFVLVFVATSINAKEWTVKSEAGHYVISIAPSCGKILLRELQSWVITVHDQHGSPVTAKQLVFYGGMQGHGHGLPSSPQVTEQLEPGKYLVDGVLFNMFGEWDIVVGVNGSAGPDKATFRLNIAPRLGKEKASVAWSKAELALLESFVLKPLSIVDPSNRLLKSPAARELGERLFFDAKLSRDGNISCASCHLPGKKLTDGKKLSFGSRELARNSPTLLGAAHARWFYWDGRRDSLWAQALTPIETPGEMDGNRTAAVRYVAGHPEYGPILASLADTIPVVGTLQRDAGPYGSDEVRANWHELEQSQQDAINHAFATIGKTLASYVASLEPEDSRFDAYVRSLSSGAEKSDHLSSAEKRGLRLFVDAEKTQCLRCHNGPYFTNFGFHNIGTGTNPESDLPDFGRMIGLRAAMVDEFNCVGKYSDTAPESCDHHRFVVQGHADNGAFKTPSLRNVAQTAPYMHDGRFVDLKSVVEYYRSPPSAEASGHELPLLNLSDDEVDDLVAFLVSLSGKLPPSEVLQHGVE